MCITNTYKETLTLNYLTFPDLSYPNIILQKDIIFISKLKIHF